MKPTPEGGVGHRAPAPPRERPGMLDGSRAIRGDSMSEEAGREMDALIAERVMGKRVTWIGPERVPMFSRTLEANDERQREGRMMVGYPGDGDVPYYSTDIASAFEVAQRFTTFSIFYDDATCTWFAAVDSKRRTPDDCRFKGAAETAPEAICKAALRATEVK